MTWLPIFILSAILIIVTFSFRFYAYKSMTERVCSKKPDADYCMKHYYKNLDSNYNQYQQCDVVYGDTPNGGVKTVICYVDDKNRTVKKKDARKVLVRELDKSNSPVFETWTPVDELGPFKCIE